MSSHEPPPVRDSLGTTFKRLIRRVIWPSNATTGTSRIEAGADTPPELQTYGILQALLFYVTDSITGLELGYFFIGQSNTLDGGGVQKVLLFGNVTYPTPGDPTSPTAANVKTNHQINLFGTEFPGVGFTVFKDSAVQFNSSVPSITIATGVATRWKNGADWQREYGGGLSVAGDPGKGVVNYNVLFTATGFTVAGAPFSAEIVSLSILNHIFEDGRCYSVEIFGGFFSATVGTAGNFFLRKGTTVAGTMWWDYFWSVSMLPGGAIGGIPSLRGYLKRTAGSGNFTSSLSLTMRSNNAATGQHYGDPTHPRGMVIYDVGEAADYPQAFVVS